MLIENYGDSKFDFKANIYSYKRFIINKNMVKALANLKIE